MRICWVIEAKNQQVGNDAISREKANKSLRNICRIFKVFKTWVVVQPSWFQNGWRQMTHENPKKGKFRSHST